MSMNLFKFFQEASHWSVDWLNWQHPGCHMHLQNPLRGPTLPCSGSLWPLLFYGLGHSSGDSTPVTLFSRMSSVQLC